MTKMILFFRAFFLILVGAEARTLLGNHHGLNKLKAEIGHYGRESYIITASPPNNEEIVGRPYPLAPPAPRHDPVIGQLTTTSPHEMMPIILLPTTTISQVGDQKKHDYKLSPPPPPKPAKEDHQIIITSSSTTYHHMINSNQHLPLQASY